jgi:hypothetical protein
MSSQPRLITISHHVTTAPSDFRKVEPNIARRSLWNTCACSKFRRRTFDLQAHSSFSRAAKTPIPQQWTGLRTRSTENTSGTFLVPVTGFVVGTYPNLSAEWLTSLLLRASGDSTSLLQKMRELTKCPKARFTQDAGGNPAVEGHDALMFH